VIGPSFYANEIPDVMTSLINTYVEQRTSDEPFIETYRRLGVAPFKEAAYKNALNKNDAKHSKGATA
jgi:sulfite reductase (NADPH) hemoprotein beta-component